MRGWRWVLVLLIGCGGEPLCGVDETTGEDRPICTVEVEDLPEALEFCPGDQWADPVACTSCGCESDGSILCTASVCGG